MSAPCFRVKILQRGTRRTNSSSTLLGAFLFAMLAKNLISIGKKKPWPKDTVEHARRGQDLCGGYFAPVTGFKQDMEWAINTWGVPGHWSSDSPCKSCFATSRKGT